LLPVVRLLARNLPLVIIDALFWRTVPEPSSRRVKWKRSKTTRTRPPDSVGVRCGPARASSDLRAASLAPGRSSPLLRSFERRGRSAAPSSSTKRDPAKAPRPCRLQSGRMRPRC
jgi:hypothetical protein